jgi:hypothetical protein
MTHKLTSKSTEHVGKNKKIINNRTQFYYFYLGKQRHNSSLTTLTTGTSFFTMSPSTYQLTKIRWDFIRKQMFIWKRRNFSTRWPGWSERNGELTQDIAYFVYKNVFEITPEKWRVAWQVKLFTLIAICIVISDDLFKNEFYTY